MGLFDAIGIAGSGLTAERIRMDTSHEPSRLEGAYSSPLEA